MKWLTLLNNNIKHIWFVCYYDKRLYTSIIAFKLQSLWFGLFMPFFISTKALLHLFIIYFIILALIVYFIFDKKQYKVGYLIKKLN